MDFRRILAIILLSTPFAWMVGVDQFLLFLVLPLAVAGILAGPLQLDRSRRLASGLLLLVLLAVALSSVSLLQAPTFRWITYLRDLLSVSALVAILALQRPARFHGEADTLVLAIVWFIFIANAIGLIAWLTDFTIAFVSPIAQLAPTFVRESDLGQSIFIKNILRAEPTYLFDQELPRVRSLFIYSNTYALALGIGLPLTLYMWLRSAMRANRVMVLVYFVSFIMCVLSMFLTASRAGMAAAMIGAAVFFWVLLGNKLTGRTRILINLSMATIALLLVASLFRNIDQVVYELAYARGAGSIESRLLIYFESIRQLFGNPIGFGTQRDAAGLGGLTLGSHSTYIAVAFKFGFLGLAAYLGFLIVLWFRIQQGLARARVFADREGMIFFATTAWAFTANLAHQVLAEIALDTLAFTVIVSFWLVIMLRTQRQISSHMARRYPDAQAAPAL
ncbi:MAG: hypothetical protein OEQ74_08830 [Gammaproteobacteria bacterium]|nr:hypothetical protein [Gammaproteobacteria bacterium]